MLAMASMSKFIYAATCQSNVTSGNWGTPTSWTGTGCVNTVPRSTDTVTILQGHTITLNVSSSVRTLTINDGGQLWADANSRTLRINPHTNQTAFTVYNSTAFLANNSTVLIVSTSSVNVNVGSITFNNLSFTTTTVLANTYTFGSSSVTVLGDFNINPTKASAGVIVMQINMGAPIRVGGTTTVQATTNARSTFTTTTNSYALTTGLLNLATNSTFLANNSQITLTGAAGTLFTRVGTFNQGGSTVTVTSDASVTINNNATLTLNHLELRPTLSANRTYTFGTSVLTMTGDFTINPDNSTVGDASLSVNMGAAITGAAATNLTITGTGNADSIFDTVSNWAPTVGRVNLEANGVFTARNSTVTVIGTSGTLWTNAGTFNRGYSNVIFSPNATVQLTQGSVDFNNLNLTPTITAPQAYTFGTGAITVWGAMNINPTAGSAQTLTVNMGDALTVVSTRTLTITRTTNALTVFDTTGNNYALTAGAINVAAGATLNANDSVITLNGTSGTLLTEGGTFIPGTSEVIMNSDAAITMTASGMTLYDLSLTPNLSAGRAWSVGTTSITVLNDLIINPSGSGALAVTMGVAMETDDLLSISGSGSATASLATGGFALVAGRLLVDTAGTLSAGASAITLNGTTGPLFTVNGTFTPATSTLSIGSDADVQIFSGTFTLNAFSLTPTLTSDRAYTIGGGSLTLNGNFTINPVKTTAGNTTLTVNMSSSIAVGAGFTTTISGTTNGYSVLDSGAGLDYPLNTGLINIAANGTYNAQNSTITLNGTAGTLMTRTGTFNEGFSLVIASANAAVTVFSGTQNLYNLSFLPTITAARTYTVGAGPHTINGDFIINPDKTTVGAAALTVNLGASGIVVAPDKTITITRTNNATTTLDTTATNYPITTGRLSLMTGGTLNGRSSLITLNGTTSPLWNQAGTFTTAGTTVTFTSDADVTLTNGTITFNFVTISPTLTANRTYEMGSGDLTMNGTFTIDPDKVSVGVATLTVNMGGAINVAATHNAILDGSGNAYSILDTVVGSNYSLNAGRLDLRAQATLRAQSATITLSATSGTLFAHAGVFESGNSIVTMTPNASVTLHSGTPSFYDLVLSPTVNAARAYTFGAGTVTVLNDFTVTPAGNNVLTVNLGGLLDVDADTLLTRTGTASSSMTTTTSNRPFQTGTLNVATNGFFYANGSSVIVNGLTGPLITRVGTYSAMTSTLTITSAASTVINSGTLTLMHLIIDTPNQTQTFGAAPTINGNLKIENGMLADGGFQIAGNATNLLTMAANTNFILGTAGTATTWPTNYTASRIALNALSTVTYNAGINQNISGTPVYGNLTLSAPSGTPTKTLLAATTATAKVTIEANNTLDVSATNLSLAIGGNYQNDGAFTSRNGTVTFNGTTAGLGLSGNMLGASDFNSLTFSGTGGQWTLNDPVSIGSTLTVTAGTLLGAVDVTVNGSVMGNGTNGTINLSGGTFEQRVALNQQFGSHIAGTNNWTFNNLTFSNSSAANRTITTSPLGTGRIIVNGDLTIGGASDTNSTTLNNNTNGRLIDVNGNMSINPLGVFQAGNINMRVRGDWSNAGVFTANTSSITLSGNTTQRIANAGQTFATIISSNISAGGVMFTSSFSASKMMLNTSDLNSSATMYFAGRSTFTVATFVVTGAAPYPVVLRSTHTGTYWHLNNTSTHTVRYVSVEDSNANSGLRIFDYPGGVSIDHNSNWAFGADTPSDFVFTSASTNTLSLGWSANVPAPDSYTLTFSTNSNFVAPTSTTSTGLTSATTSFLLVNTTYHARINSIVSGLLSDWSSTLSTATLARAPVTAASTWTAVNFTSVTVAWLGNGNPSPQTRYVLELSTVSAFNAGVTFSSSTYNLQATIQSMSHGETYYARVKAVNHSNIDTAWFLLGSTVTQAPSTPSNFRFTASSTHTLTTAWDAPVPPGNSYTFQVSTDSLFNGTVISSSTLNLFATSTAPLTANTTYYGRVNSINAGIASAWSTELATATLANIPASAASTWTFVNYTSFTVNWLANGNPTGITRYVVDLATASDFLTEEFYSSSTYNLSATFEDLFLGSTYFARIKAVNHGELNSSYLTVGSTKTTSPTTCNAAVSGNWDTAGTWVNCTGPGGFPATTDLITINSGISVIVNVDATVAGIVFAASNANNSLTQLSTVTLTVNGPVTMHQPLLDNRTTAWNLNASTATVGGLIMFAGTNDTTTRVSQINITSGELNAFNGFTFASSTAPAKVINMSGGAGQLNMKGNMTLPANSSTLNAGGSGSIFNYADDTSAQTVRFFTEGAYHNLYLNNTSASGATLGAAVTAANVTGHLRVQSGTFKNGGFGIVGNAGRTFEVSNGATFEMSGTSTFPTTFDTFTFGPTSRVRYLQTSTPLTLTTQTYGHLDLMPAGTATQNFPAGEITIEGDLSIGDGTNVTTVGANATGVLTVRGNWTNLGSFVHNNSTVVFAGASAQSVQHAGQGFGHVTSSNASAGGLIFNSSFSAARLFVNTVGLGSAATMYFNAGSTVTVSSFSITGSALYPAVLKSNVDGTPWHINNTSTHAVVYAQVKDSHAFAGRRILALPGSVDLGNNVNWVFEVNVPTGLDFNVVNISSFTAAWSPPSPAADTYTLETSTASDFTGTLTSSDTVNLYAVPFGTLIPNTTYFARVKSVINGVSSSWSSNASTVTLANIPASAASTWTAVNLTSITVSWLSNSNPTITWYTVQMSTASTFDGEDDIEITTQTVTTNFLNLNTATTYHARVKAVNHSEISTEWFLLGSTNTQTPVTCNANTVGTWSWTVGANWLNCTGPGGVPSATDIITINSGVNVIANVDATVGGIILASPGTNNSLTHLSTVTLTVNGNVTLSAATTANRTSGWNINNGTATVTGLISFPGAPVGTRISSITVTSGQLNALGGITFAANTINTNKIIVLSGSTAQLNLKGALTVPNPSATLTAGVGSIFNYNDDSAAQTISTFPAGGYNNLHVNNTSVSGATLGAAISATNVAGNLRVQSGTLKNGGLAIVGGAGDTFQVADGATFEMSGTSAFPTTFGTFTFGPTSRTRYLQSSAALNITVQSYGHLDLMPSATATRTFLAGANTIQGDLTIGDGTNATTVTANTNNTVLTVSSAVTINPNATFTAHASNPLVVRGDWRNNGVFTHNNSTISFQGISAQYVNNYGKPFANVLSSNTSAGGLVFSSSFSAARLLVNTNGLSPAATVYFAAGSTFTVSTFTITGTSGAPVVLRSIVTGNAWFLNNTTSYNVSYADVRDSNASGGRRIVNYPGGVDSGNNVNWVFGSNPPPTLQAINVALDSIGYSWSAATPLPDTYTLFVSTNSGFSAPLTSALNALTSDTTAGLKINTTYYARVIATIEGLDSAPTTVSTATLAEIPLSAASTWTAVNTTSITVTWLGNNNPFPATWFRVQLSTVPDFLSGTTLSSTTNNLNSTFSSLIPDSIYFGRVAAVNHSGVPTAFVNLGSTATLPVNAPTGLFISSAATNRLTGGWTASAPTGDSYTFQVSTASNFSGTITSSNTTLLIATTSASLSVNTTYYGRVNAIINGSSSPWSASVTTATLANQPASAASTWTAVNITSLTVNWLGNGNPAAVTQYAVQLTTVSDFLSGTLLNAETNSLDNIFDQLESGTVYYARVRAINHSGIPSDWQTLGSTHTIVSAIPKNLAFSSAATTALSATWQASAPPGDTYTLRVSTDSDFGGTIVSSTTGNLFATTMVPLIPNTTYYGQVSATVGGIPYPYSAYVTTPTLANIPLTAASTWTAVNVTSLTVNWLSNSNPSSTLYTVQLSTVSNFLSGTVHSSDTTDTAVLFESLLPFRAYFARVRAISHSNIPTSWLTNGSTTTLAPNMPNNFFFTSAATNTLSASWSQPVPAGTSYTMQVSTASDFSGSLVSSITANLFATLPATLSVNTTYYGRANAIVGIATSAWTTGIATATLANRPVTVASTWTAVNLTSFTVNWAQNGNPASVTRYMLQISTSTGFDGFDDIFISTFGLNAVVESLETATVYYGQVKAINHSDIDSAWFLLGSTNTRTPTTCNATTTGNWSNASIWTNCTGLGGFPSATDIITINSTITVTVNVDATVGGIIFAAPGAISSALTHSSTNVLIVNGNVVFNQPTTPSRNNSWNIGDASATVNGLINFAGASATTSRVSRIVIDNGTLNAYGGMTFAASANDTKIINMSGGAGRINLKGALSISNARLLTGTAGSVFNYADSSSGQTVQFFPAGSYENLHISNISGSGATLSAAITGTNVTGNVVVASGTFKNGGFAIAGNAGKSFHVMDDATFEMSGTSAFPTVFGTFTFDPLSRVRYLQTNTQNIAGQTFGHLDLVPAASATHNLPAATFNVLGDLTIGANATLNASSNQLISVGGNWSNSGLFNANSGTVTFNGAETQTLAGSTTFYALRAITSNTTIYFTPGTTQHVTHAVEFRDNTLRSISDDDPWHFRYAGSSQTLINVSVRDSNASAGALMQTQPLSVDLGNNTRWDFGSPSAVNNFSAFRSTFGAAIDLTWTSPGEDGSFGTLINSTFTIQYTTDTIFAEGNSWSPTAAQPAHVYRLNIATTNITAGSGQGRTITGLISGGTYYFRLWTTDINNNTSSISNGATTYAQPTNLSITLSTNTLSLPTPINLNTTLVISTGITVTNNGNVPATFEFAATTATPGSPWQIAATTATDRFVLWSIINATEPNATDFGVEDKLSDAFTRCTSTVISNSGSNCVDLPVGATRTIWFKLGMPGLTTTGNAQEIRITGKATVPD